MEILPGLFRTRGLLVKQPATSTRDGRAAVAMAVLGLRRISQYAWQQAKTVDIIWQASSARRTLAAFQPDLVHAFRIQTEGYVAALVNRSQWILSIWGQDFVWFARAYPVHRHMTRWAVRRADAIIADCKRDLQLACEAGFPADGPTLLCPGNGGVDFNIYNLGAEACRREPLIVYPRGLVPYVRLDTLLRATALLDRSGLTYSLVILMQRGLIPVATAMAAAATLCAERVSVLPMLDQSTWAALLQRAAVMVSPAVSDGTPNTMLEAMACGAFPVMGDLASVREWIRHGVNGLLFDPNDPEQLAACLEEAIRNDSLRKSAQIINLELVRDRADYARIMPTVREFYRAVGTSASENLLSGHRSA